MPEIIEVSTPGELIVIEGTGDEISVAIDTIEVVEVAEQGPAGAPGSPPGGLSNDPGNAITHGSDGGIYAPDDIPTDPLAYYILARS